MRFRVNSQHWEFSPAYLCSTIVHKMVHEVIDCSKGGIREDTALAYSWYDG